MYCWILHNTIVPSQARWSAQRFFEQNQKYPSSETSVHRCCTHTCGFSTNRFCFISCIIHGSHVQYLPLPMKHLSTSHFFFFYAPCSKEYTKGFSVFNLGFHVLCKVPHSSARNFMYIEVRILWLIWVFFG